MPTLSYHIPVLSIEVQLLMWDFHFEKVFNLFFSMFDNARMLKKLVHLFMSKQLTAIILHVFESQAED